MKTYAILGHPVSHSLSPKIHNAVFRQLGLADHSYIALDVLPDQLEGMVHQLRTGEYEAFSVTIPHKQAIIPFLDELTERAEKVGAVNTVVRKVGRGGKDRTVRLWGDNTDYFGFEKSLEEANIIGSNPKKALVLGSGGAARAVIAVLSHHQFQVTVAARNPTGSQLHYHDLNPSDPWSIIVNTTPVGMAPDPHASVLTDPSWFRPDRRYVDIIYTPKMTRFLRLAAQAGARVISGDRMFLWQAVEQARLFSGGRQPPVETMEEILLKSL